MQSNTVYFSVLRLFCVGEQCPKSYLIAFQAIIRLQTDRIAVLSHTYEVSLTWSWPTESEAGSSSSLWEEAAALQCGIQVKAWLLQSIANVSLVISPQEPWEAADALKVQVRDWKDHKMFFDKGPQQRLLKQWVGGMDGALRLHLLCSCQSKTKASHRQSAATILFLHHKHNFYLTFEAFSLYFILTSFKNLILLLFKLNKIAGMSWPY